MNPVSYDAVIGATKSVELHHFRNTGIVACMLVLQDGKTILSLAEVPPTAVGAGIPEVAAQARQEANAEVARYLTEKQSQVNDVQLLEGAENHG